jgi:hypothetical protein
VDVGEAAVGDGGVVEASWPKQLVDIVSLAMVGKREGCELR